MSLLPQWLRRVLALLFTLVLVPAFAADTDSKPFAEKKVVLQISDDDASKQTLVLNVASNLISHYGPERVDVEIVAFGAGLRLLFADNSNASRIDNLAADGGVRFSACENATRKVTQELGDSPAFNPNAQYVSGGAVRIVDLVGQGYILLKP